jgi:hypothetical protein
MAAGIAGLGLSGGGCALVDGVRVTTNRTKETVEDSVEWKRDKKWADEAWAKARQCDPNIPQSGDFSAGFREGFATYVYRGGSGEPPPLPPRSYRALKYQTPQGYQAIESWFDGYRYGASVARDGGYRQLVTGPAAVPACGPAGCSPPQTLPAQGTAANAVPEGAPPIDIVQAVSVSRQPTAQEVAEPPADDDSPSFPLTLTPPDDKPRARITGVHSKPQPSDTNPHPRITNVHTIPGPTDPRPDP